MVIDPTPDDPPHPAPAAHAPRRGLALALFGVLNLGILIALFLVPLQPGGPEFAIAERFAGALVDGPDGELRSGYDRAHALLSAAMQREWPLEDWAALFEDRVAEWGFLEEMVLDPEGVSGTSAVRQLDFEMRYAGAEGAVVTERVRLVLHRGPAGPRVAALQFMD